MRTTLARIAAILSFGAAIAAQAQPASTPPAAAKARAGELCPPGRWFTEGGNAARNAASANPPMLRRPAVAWRQTLPGPLLGEPLVWGDHVVVAVRLGPGRTAIEARRLHDGTLIGQRALNSASAPAPTLWGNEVVWRVGISGLELLRIGAKSLDFVARLPAVEVVDAPLRVGTTLYAVVDGKVTAMRAADFRVLWQSTQSGFRGPLALTQGSVYGVAGRTDGTFVVAALARDGGKELGTSTPLVVRPPAVGEQVRLQLAGDTLLASLGTGHLFPEFQAPVPLNGLDLVLPLRAGRDPRPIALPVPRALDGRVQVAAVTTPEGPQLGLFPAGKDEGVRLDTCELHRALASVPPTLAGDVMYFGACAVDTKEYRMLWRVQRDGDQPLPAVRAIPAGRTLLLGHERELWALREEGPADPIAAELAAHWQTRQRERLTALVDAAVQALDLDLAAELLGRSRELAADEAWAQKREKDLASRRKAGKVKTDTAKATTVRTAADGASRESLDDVLTLVGTWTTRPAIEQRHGLRFVLEQAPDHAGALAAVRKLLPRDLTATEPLHGRDWLDFLDAIAHTEVRFLEAAEADFRSTDFDAVTLRNKQQLLEWRANWRQDLRALLSQRLLLFSPITHPGSLAKALATGELVCDALESMFAGMPAVRQDPRPMLVFIYPDRAEYLEASAKLGIDAEWTAGYYSDALNELVPKSRLFVPADDTGFATVLPTLAHELTHQWLRDRCPAFVPDPVASRVGPKAFWIVEGFASLVEQFEFDLARRQFRFGRGNLERADLVASAEPAQLLDWSWLVGCPRLEFDRLRANQKAVAVPSSARLGQRFRTRGVDLFYAQSAMLARYLYDAEDGRHRPALLRYVVAFYTGDKDHLDFERAFGVAAKDLGEKVVAYSRALVQ